MYNFKYTKLVSLFVIILIFLSLSNCKKDQDNDKSREIPEVNKSKSETNKEVIKDKDALNAAMALQKSLRNVAKSITPAVVNIRAIKIVKRRLPGGKFFKFFRRRMPRRRGQAIGSGFIINKKGYIITNSHVVKNATKINVVLQDEREFKARVIGTDPATDIALLKIDPSGEDLPTCPIGDSDNIAVGDFAIAIGNPFGLRGSVTFGIISATGRSRLSGTDASLKNFIQTDVPINRGNSGGPLLNIQGQVIGVNSMIYSPSGGNIGIGFAIPINIVKNVVSQIIKKGKVERGFIGAMIQPIDSATARHFGLKRKRGVIIASVKRGGPADKAGLRSGDIVLEVNGKKIKNFAMLKRIISSVEPGSKITMKILRGEDKKTVTLRVGKMSEAKNTNMREYYEGGGSNRPKEYSENGSKKMSWLGMGISEADTSGDGSFFGQNKGDKYKTLNGIQVENVREGSSADKAGIKPGDIILSINYRQIKSLRQFKAFINKAGNKKSYFLKINRRGRIIFKTIEK